MHVLDTGYLLLEADVHPVNLLFPWATGFRELTLYVTCKWSNLEMKLYHYDSGEKV